MFHKNYIFSIFLMLFSMQKCSAFGLVSIAELQAANKAFYQKIESPRPFCFTRFPFSFGDHIHPYQGAWQETFVVTIPNGRIHSSNGWVTIDNNCVTDLLWRHNPAYVQYADKVTDQQLRKVPGRVVALAQIAYGNYYHYLYEILGRLSLIEEMEYDWIYVPCNKPWMKQLLQLWGVDLTKVIDPTIIDNFYIQANELIVPSMIINTCFQYEPNFGGYLRPNIVQTISNRLCQAVDAYPNTATYSKKIFISRKDGERNVSNEDEIFAILQTKGFERYTLSKMSVVEQIKLFQQAESIVAIHGAGCCNMMFSKPGTQFVELFQALADTTFFYLAQTTGMRYTPVQTVDFIKVPGLDAHINTTMPLFIIQKVADSL